MLDLSQADAYLCPLFLHNTLRASLSADLEHIRQIMREADCLYTEAEVEAAIARVGAQITAEMAETNPVVFCVMNGGLIFSGKLLTHLQFPLEASYSACDTLSQ